MYDWALWKAKVTDDTVRFVNITDLPNSGFASVYLFSEADTRSMEATGTYKAFRGTVFSPILKVDCDDESAADATRKTLLSIGCTFAEYSTGGRGRHYHIPRTANPGHLLPALDKAYVARVFPQADTSFYHHVGMYRQIGARHHKTGLPKTVVDVWAGPVLDMTAEQLPTNSFPKQSLRGEVGSVFADRYLSSLTVPYSNGERHRKYCAIAARLEELHQPLEWAFVYLANVDLLSEEPLGESDLRRILDWAYSRRVA